MQVSGPWRSPSAVKRGVEVCVCACAGATDGRARAARTRPNPSHSEDSVAETALSKKNSDGKRERLREATLNHTIQ